MDPAPGSDRPLWCTSLLERLRSEGFDIGVRHVLLIEHLLDRIGLELPERLGTVLAPIVARNPEEQRRFHEVFKEYLLPGAVWDDPENEAGNTTIEHRVPTTVLEPAPRVPWWRRRRFVFATLFVAALAAAVYINWPRPTPIPEPPPPPPSGPVTPPGPTTAGVFPTDVRSLGLRVAAPPRTTDWTPIRIGLAAIPLLLLAWYLLSRRRRNHAAAVREAETTAPYVLPIRIPAATATLYPVSDVASSSRMLRRRQQSTEVRLSIEGTIGATIHANGFPTIRYERVTRPAEYLALIELTAPRDHQAQCFDEMVQRFASEGVFISRYYFQRDPRVCFTEDSTEGVKLADLVRQHEGDRLLVFADGHRWLHPVRGTPMPWLELLEPWADRALLTPVPAVQWGRREAALRRVFTVLPATLEGLRATVEHFEAGTRPDLSRWKERDRSEPLTGISLASAVEELRTALGDDLFRWVAACAAFPELHWDLTAMLGGLGEVGTGVRTEPNILRLIRLPWFRDGLMPEELRTALLDELARMDRASGLDTELAVRQTIVRVLDHERLDPESVAGHTRTKQLLQQRLHLYLDRPGAVTRTLDELEGEMAADEMVRDATVVRALEKKGEGRLAFRLPEAFRRWLWRGGVPGLGPTQVAATAMAGAVAALVWVGFPPPPTASVSASGPEVYPNILAIAGPVGAVFELHRLQGSPPADSVPLASADPSIARWVRDTVMLAGTGTSEILPGNGAPGVPIRIEVLSFTQPALPNSGVLRTDRTMTAGTFSAPEVVWGGESIVSCDSVAEVRNGSVHALRPGSTILIDESAAGSLIGVRVLHVAPGTTVGVDSLIRFVNEPLDRWPEPPDTRYDSVLSAKARAFAELARRDPDARLAMTVHLIGDRYVADLRREATRPNTATALRIRRLRDLFLAGGVPADRLDLRRHVSGLSCGARPLGPAVKDGDLDRVDLHVGYVSESVTTNPEDQVRIQVSPATMNLRVGQTARLVVQFTDPADQFKGQEPNWESSRPQVVQVSRSGMLRARLAGTAEVTARLGPASDVAIVTVSDSVPDPGVVVPNLTGRTVTAALQILRSAGLVPGGVDSMASGGCVPGPAGVASSTPTAGARVERGSSVRLQWRDSVPAEVRVPLLEGMQLGIASRELRARCLRLGKIDSVTSGSPTQQAPPAAIRPGAFGMVIRQSLGGGSLAKTGAVVDVVVRFTTTGSPSTPPDNRTFVLRVFAELLGTTNPVDLNRSIAGLDSGMSRTTFLRSVAGRRELASVPQDEFIRRAFRTVVCRDPTSEELKNLVGRYGQETSRETILMALLDSSPAARVRESCIGQRPAASTP
jgi:hypothetical protein